MIYPHKPEHVKIIQVIGDSMQNNGGGFLNGDWILFLNDGNVVSDGPYVIVIDSQLFVKQLQFRPKGAILVISINPQ
jgi:phage repressor protein C with HTH and peptisase S24 domain